MATPRVFSPSTPLPIKFDVAKQIRQLQDGLHPSNPYYEREGQHTNIRALIKLYESGQKLDNKEESWIMNGKVVSKEEALKSKEWALVEVRRSNSSDKNVFN